MDTTQINAEAERRANAFFEEREPGSVLEDEYQEKVEEFRQGLELVDEFRAEARRHRDAAERALKATIKNAQDALEDLYCERVRSTVGGSVLNQQVWQDAERSLVRYWDAASAAAVAERF